MHEKLLLILSPNSIDSEWVKTEIRKARKRERTEKKRVLFPVRVVSLEAIRDWELFDADEGKDLAVEIRELFIPDFSEWKNHDPYAVGLKNLLRDLKTESPLTFAYSPLRCAPCQTVPIVTRWPFTRYKTMYGVLPMTSSRIPASAPTRPRWG